MRLFLKIIFLYSFLCLSCEKDDICAESSPSTPLLIVRFYNADSPEEFKTVTNLRIVGEGKKEALEKYNGTSTDSIAIPLKIFATMTRYKMTRNYRPSTDPENKDEELVEFTYKAEELFLYRGCGFMSTFNNMKMMVTKKNDNWIKNFEIVIPKVENEFQAHIKIYH